MPEAHETMEHAEHAEHAAHSNRKIALLIAVLALFLSFSETLGKSAQTEAISANVKSSDTWAFYQAKDIRRTVLNAAADQTALLAAETTDPAAKAAIDKQIDAWRSTVARYESDPKTGEGRKELAERAKAEEEDRVNPSVVCKVVWANSWSDPAKEKDAVNALVSLNADVISGSPNTPVQGLAAEEKGVWAIGSTGDFSAYVKQKQLSSFDLDWGPAYIEAARHTLAGDWKPTAQWRGLGPGGFVKMTTQNPALPKEVLDLMTQKEKAIIESKLHPFTGEIKDQSGKVRVAAGTTMPDQELRSINWLAEGIQGTLPAPG